MLRAGILFLTLLLITLSAAHLGREMRGLEALLAQNPTQLPVKTPPAPSPDEPKEPTPSAAPLPRFAPDLRPAGRAEPEKDSPTPDPAPAQKKPVVIAAQPRQPAQASPLVPSEEQKLRVAEPFVRAMLSMKKDACGRLNALCEQAMGDYLAAEPSLRRARLVQIAARYGPQAEDLLRETDAQAEVILADMAKALAAIGADDAIVADARSDYEESRAREIERCSQIFASLG